MQGDSNKDPLLSNKIAGAVLAALLLVFGLPQLTAAIYGGGGHHGGAAEELHLAYCCVELETAPASAADEAPKDLGTLLASASASAGERRAALCKSCHTFDEGGAQGTGPNLWNVVERPVASVAGFNYSPALKEFGGVWSYERLDEYINNSQDYIPGTAMVQRFARDDQRADILAYLRSLSDDPVDFPPPVEAPAEETPVVETAGEILEEAEERADNGAEAIEEAVQQNNDALDE